MTRIPRRHLLFGPIILSALLLSSVFVGCGDGGNTPTEPGDGPPPAAPIPCLDRISACEERVPVGGYFRLPVYRTHPIQDGDSTVVLAIFVVHGADRRFGVAFEGMVEAVRLAGQTDSMMVISPHFQTTDDGPGSSEPTWTSGGWKRGDESNTLIGTNQTVSSYEAVDHVLRFLGNPEKFPNLGKVVVAGHSAGGQYSHRYAATSPAAEDYPHLQFRYVVANPSTYLYLGPERATADGGFALPDRAQCPNYNVWHYGMENRNPYALNLTENETRDRLVGRDVVYMVGSADTGESWLDMSCGAMLQGEHRYARGLTLFDYMNTIYPGHLHHLFVVYGIAHSSRGMYQSNEGRHVLFEW